MAEAAADPRFRTFARLAGPALFLVVLLIGPSAVSPEGRLTLAVAAWMMTWLITECVPIIATSLLPMVLFPVLGVATSRETAAPYANDLVFLFMGGFFLAAALEHWESHVRVAYRMVLGIGLSAKRVVLGVMLATGFISMWISNTATTAMMYPIAMAIGALFARDEHGNSARTALMLGVAYAASIGGMATVIGTPPNLVVAGAIREMAGSSVSFVQWMALGVPIAFILLPLTWLTLVYVTFPVRGKIEGAADGVLRSRLEALGPIRGGEARVLTIFLGTALAWFFRERKEFGSFTVPGLVDLVPGLTDAAIAVTAAVLLFIVSGTTREGTRRPLLTWTEARTIPWDVLLFFGGGLTLAQQIEAHGITTWMATWLGGLRGLPTIVIYLGLAVTVLVLSELASNLAVAAMMMPISVALAQSIGHSPVLLMLVTGFAASTGFMLPVATPPNTIVFGSGLISVRQMARAGFLVDIIGVLLIVVVITLLAPLVF